MEVGTEVLALLRHWNVELQLTCGYIVWIFQRVLNIEALGDVCDTEVGVGIFIDKGGAKLGLSSHVQGFCTSQTENVSGCLVSVEAVIFLSDIMRVLTNNGEWSGSC